MVRQRLNEYFSRPEEALECRRRTRFDKCCGAGKFGSADVAAASAWSPTAGGARSSADGLARTPTCAKPRSADIGCSEGRDPHFTKSGCKTDRLMSSRPQ